MKIIVQGMRRALTGFQAAALVFAVLAVTGCEDDKKTDDVDAYFAANPLVEQDRPAIGAGDLEIDPQEVEAMREGQQINFKVRGGSGPYNWRVANQRYGTLEVNGWSEAIYTVRQIANNEVIVTDQRGHAAIASVWGSLPEPAPITPLSAVANPDLLENDGDKSVLTVEGGRPPYRWTVLDAALGHLVGSDTGASVVYMRDHNGDNVVEVRDANGTVFHVRIEQP